MDDILSTSEEKTWHYHWFLKILYDVFRLKKWTIIFIFQCPLFKPNIINFTVIDTKWWTEFVEKHSLIFDNGEDIYYQVLIAVVMLGVVSVNETSTAYWLPFLSKLIDCDFLVIMF